MLARIAMADMAAKLGRPAFIELPENAAALGASKDRGFPSSFIPLLFADVLTDPFGYVLVAVLAHRGLWLVGGGNSVANQGIQRRSDRAFGKNVIGSGVLD